MRRFDMHSIRRLGAGALFLAGSSACDSPVDVPGGTPPPQPSVAYVEILAPAGELAVGQSVPLGVRLLSADGQELDRPVTWTSSDTAVASVSPGGVVTGRAAGAVDVTARSGDVDAMVSVTVREQAMVVTIELDAPPAELTVGQTFVMTARVRDQDGALLYRPIAWTSSDTAVATISAQGVISARAIGQAAITAAADGRQATVQLSVRSGAPALLTELSPSAVRAGASVFELTIRGTGFEPGARVRWAGQERTARVIGATEVRVDITAADVAHVGAAEVQVLNPGQTMGSRLYFMIEGTTTTRVFDLVNVAWLEAPLPFEVGAFHIDGDITRAASQRVLAGVFRIHEPAYGRATWDLTITMETALIASGEIVRREDLLFFGSVEYGTPDGRMRLRSGLFPNVVLETLTEQSGDLLILQSLHPSGDTIHEKAWRYRER
jgi:hypothetical protein